MKKNSIKKSLTVLLVFVSLLLQNCTNQEAIKPQPTTAAPATEFDMLEKIKTLGFADNQIREMQNYYLVDGDIYFPKKSDPSKLKPKPKRVVTEEYVTFNIRVDESISKNQSWMDGINKAIEKWNADKDKHFHFALSNSQDPDITFLKDNTLPDDVDVVADFPLHGRIGVAIRVNSNPTQGDTQESIEQTLFHALKHCAGANHNQPAKHNVIAQNTISTSARTEEEPVMLYLLQGDWLYSRNMTTQEITPLSGGWEGSDAMTDCISGTTTYLYITQFGYLYQVNLNTGEPKPLTGGWEGTVCITRIDGFGTLYIILGAGAGSWSGSLWSVRSWDGTEYPQLGANGRFPSAASAVAFYDKGAKIAVLSRGSSNSQVNVSVLWLSNAALIKSTNMTTAGTSNTLFKAINWTPYYLQVFSRGKLFDLINDGTIVKEQPTWNNITALGGLSSGYVWLVNNGTLGEYDPHYYSGGQLDSNGFWAGTTSLVVIFPD